MDGRSNVGIDFHLSSNETMLRRKGVMLPMKITDASLGSIRQ
jgi:hypothetical protein